MLIDSGMGSLEISTNFFHFTGFFSISSGSVEKCIKVCSSSTYCHYKSSKNDSTGFGLSSSSSSGPTNPVSKYFNSSLGIFKWSSSDLCY